MLMTLARERGMVGFTPLPIYGISPVSGKNIRKPRGFARGIVGLKNLYK